MARLAVPTKFHETIRRLCAVTRSGRGKAAISAAGGLGLRTAISSVLADFRDATLLVSISPANRSEHPLVLIEAALERLTNVPATFALTMQEPQQSKREKIFRLTQTKNWVRRGGNESPSNKLLIIKFCQFMTPPEVGTFLHDFDEELRDDAPGLILTGNRDFSLPANWQSAEDGNKTESGKLSHLGADYCDRFDQVATIDYLDVIQEDVVMMARHLGCNDSEMDAVLRSVSNGAKPTYRQIKREITRIRARSQPQQDA